MAVINVCSPLGDRQLALSDSRPCFPSAYEVATILVNRGDRCEQFATELRDDGFDASAPELGENVVP